MFQKSASSSTGFCGAVVSSSVVGILEPDEDACVDVRRGVDLGIIEEEQDGSEHRLDTVEHIPTLASQLARVLIFTRFVEDRDAESAVGVNVGVADALCQEFERRRLVWVIVRELHLGLEIGTVPGAVGVDDPEADFPAKEVRLVGLEWNCMLVLAFDCEFL
ncbi:hypothetical protein HG531_003519 [Fusarium graminearum]|nr:hypothetical protein HG531_003519 [Fusarium graminearum]